MINVTRFFVPRKYQKLIGIPICLFLLTLVLLVTHMFGILIGIVSRELFSSDSDIVQSIPVENPAVLNFPRQLKMYNENVSQNVKNLRNQIPMHLNSYSTMGCTKKRDNIVFVIRIPKCASTSFVNLLKRLSNQGYFHMSFNPSGAFDWDSSARLKVANQVKAEILQSHTLNFIYARHFYYVNFATYGLKNFTYVTIIREPVSRFVSSYLYYHFSSKQHIQAILNWKHKNESIKTCLDFGHEGCQCNLMTKYFCGHEPFCKEGSMETLQRAKDNIEMHFKVVGIMEDMTLTYKLLKYLLPSYFQSLNPESDAQKKQNKNEHVADIPLSLRVEIEERNKYDVLLYYYIRERLYFQANACSITV